MQLRLKSDTISGHLRRVAAAGKRQVEVHRAVGEVVVQLAKRAFNDAGLRAAPWAPKADGSPATLRKNQVLARSPRVVRAGPQEVIVGSDRKYAAIHQLGGRTGPRTIRARGRALKFQIGGRTIYRKSVKHPGAKVPARPYFPFVGTVPTAVAARNMRAAIQAKLKV